MKSSFSSATRLHAIAAFVTLGFSGVSALGYSDNSASIPSAIISAPIAKIEKKDFAACTETTNSVKVRAVTRDQAVAQCSALKDSKGSQLDWCMWGEDVLLASHHIDTGWCD